MTTLPDLPACTTLKERLNMCAIILGMIADIRERRQDPALASSIERQIVDRELRELEAEISENPGALQHELSRTLRRPRAGND